MSNNTDSERFRREVEALTARFEQAAARGCVNAQTIGYIAEELTAALEGDDA